MDRSHLKRVAQSKAYLQTRLLEEHFAEWRSRGIAQGVARRGSVDQDTPAEERGQDEADHREAGHSEDRECQG